MSEVMKFVFGKKTKKRRNSNNKKSNKKSKSRNAKIFDISKLVTKNYSDIEYLPLTPDEAMPKINSAIRKKKMKVGDIFFVGSNYEGRQHYGFGVVVPKTLANKLYFIGNDTQRGLYAMLQDEVLPHIKEHNVKYKDVVTKLKKKKSSFDYLSVGTPQRLFFDDLSKDEIKYLEAEYKKENIW